MSLYKKALELASQGLHVFPLLPMSKLPAIEDWQHKATTDADQIRQWWIDPVMGWEQDYNIGIYTGRFNCAESLIVVDIDAKGEKNGYATAIQLELEGCPLPDTRKTVTPTGGCHLFYRIPEPRKSGAGVLGNGIDIRSGGGFVVAPDSVLETGIYVSSGRDDIRPAPEWLGAKLHLQGESRRTTAVATAEVDAGRAAKRAVEYLSKLEPVTEGGRNHAAFIAAAKLKDLGCDQIQALELMVSHFKTVPPLDESELEHVTNSAFSYGRNPPAMLAPEAAFPLVETPAEKEAAETGHPFEEMNKKYAFVVIGSNHAIIEEGEDEEGRAATKYLAEATFHKKLASHKMQIQVGKRTENIAITKLWMDDPSRRTYDGVLFDPSGKPRKGWYNLWHGFAYPPENVTDERSVRALEAFKDHALTNVCRGDRNLYHWLMCYFAITTAVASPMPKPLVALVFRGAKGVGKNALIERVGALLGRHFLVTSNRRYLTSNFNGHLESLLGFVLDEAYWHGDKQAEGVLKDLVTGSHHIIERKGLESYRVKNLTRVVIIGNEKYLVPATEDERRFAVFDVGDGRKQDREYFKEMREAMEAGGYKLLHHFLANYAITADVNLAPTTDALAEQKMHNLGIIEQWWMESLQEGRIIQSNHAEWPGHIRTTDFREALRRYVASRGVGKWDTSDTMITRTVQKFMDHFASTTVRESGAMVKAYKLPSLGTCRAKWDSVYGTRTDWE